MAKDIPNIGKVVGTQKCPCCQELFPLKLMEEGYTGPLCPECERDGYWMDPMGTIHGPNDDPALAYI